MVAAKKIIDVDPGILGGKPVFRGTRVAVQTLFDYLQSSSLDDFLEGYPGVSRQQAEAVIEWASTLIHTIALQYEGAA